MRKTVLITGAGRGLGRAIAEAYHRAGFYVVASDIRLELLSDLSGKEGFLTLQMDVGSESGMEKAVATVNEHIDRLDVLVSNAGIFDFYPLSESGSEKLRNIFDVNVFGLVNLTKYFMPMLLAAKGRLIVISSESYKIPAPFQPYAVSKQSLESLFEAVKIELTLQHIKSVLIRPGAIQTQIMEETLHFSNFLPGSKFEKQFMRFIHSIPKYIGKISSPDDVAHVVLKAGTVRTPKSVYHINHNPAVSILSGLPAMLKNRLIMKSLKP